MAWNSIFGSHFGRFLQAGWSDWADSFCIVPGVLRHKFRVPITYLSENFEIPLFGGRPPLGGPSKVFFGKNKKIPSVLRSIGHHIRYLLQKFEHILEIWHTLPYMFVQLRGNFKGVINWDWLDRRKEKETKMRKLKPLRPLCTNPLSVALCCMLLDLVVM